MASRNQLPNCLPIIATVIIALLLLGVIVSGVHAGNDGGYALGFSGGFQYVDALLDGTTLSQVTVEMWIKPSPLLVDSGIFQWANELYATGPFIYFRYNAGTVILYVDSDYRITTTISPDTWTHIAATYVGTVWRLYRNGTLAGTYPGGTAYQANAQSVYFGNGYASYVDPWSGVIDEARIWNVARTQGEIQADMFKELTGSPSGLMAYYKFNDGAGITATNSVGGHNGTLHNLGWVTSTAPLGNLTAYQNGIAAMWAGQTSTASDGIATGLDIADAGFLHDAGDDIIFAHNNATFANVTTDLPVGVDKRWARVWELDVNDAAGTTGGNVDLTFDISDAGGQGNFIGSGTYSLLKRAAGSNGAFSTVSVVSTSVAGDQLTFRVDVSNLGSEFTLGATSDSPTALSLQNLVARSNAGIPIVLPLGMLVMVLSGAALIWRRRRHMQ